MVATLLLMLFSMYIVMYILLCLLIFILLTLVLLLLLPYKTILKNNYSLGTMDFGFESTAFMYFVHFFLFVYWLFVLL